MKRNEKLKNIVQGFVQINEASALILGSSSILQYLNNQKEIYVDGTFKVNIKIILY